MIKLGFHAPLIRLYVFVKNEANSVWYYLEDGQKRYIQESALTGVLKRVELKEATTSFGNELKADFEILADRRYVLRSGVNSAFTKGMLMAIAALPDERLKLPITIELKAGEEKGDAIASCLNLITEFRDGEAKDANSITELRDEPPDAKDAK